MNYQRVSPGMYRGPNGQLMRSQQAPQPRAPGRPNGAPPQMGPPMTMKPQDQGPVQTLPYPMPQGQFGGGWGQQPMPQQGPIQGIQSAMGNGMQRQPLPWPQQGGQQSPPWLQQPFPTPQMGPPEQMPQDPRFAPNPMMRAAFDAPGWQAYQNARQLAQRGPMPKEAVGIMSEPPKV